MEITIPKIGTTAAITITIQTTIITEIMWTRMVIIMATIMDKTTMDKTAMEVIIWTTIQIIITTITITDTHTVLTIIITEMEDLRIGIPCPVWINWCPGATTIGSRPQIPDMDCLLFNCLYLLCCFEIGFKILSINNNKRNMCNHFYRCNMITLNDMIHLQENSKFLYPYVIQKE